jgi:hypothetical protein
MYVMDFFGAINSEEKDDKTEKGSKVVKVEPFKHTNLKKILEGENIQIMIDKFAVKLPLAKSHNIMF